MREGKPLNPLENKKLKLGRDLHEKWRTKMTNREFLTAIVAANINDELTAFAQDSLGKLDHTNELRKVKAAEKAVEKEATRAPIRDAIMNCITDEPKTATTLITEAGVELKPQAIPSLLKAYVADGTLVKTKIKVTGKGQQVGYARA